MFTTILLICVDSFVCSEGLLAFFTELITVGIKDPQGQDVRMDKKSIIRLWSCGYHHMISMNASDILSSTFLSYRW